MNQRIRILSVIHELGWAGDESRILSMSRTLDQNRFEHVVLKILDDDSWDAGTSGFREREKQYREMGVEVRKLWEEIPESDWVGWLPGRLYVRARVLRRAWRLARFVRRWRADVIDARTAAGFVSALAGRITSTPVSITFYGMVQGRALPWTARLGMRLADHIVTDSEIRGKEFRGQLPRNEHKVVVIPNGIPEPQSTYQREEARRVFGLPIDPEIRVITQLARLIEFKGQSILLRAARKVLDQYPNAAFLIVGYTENKQYPNSLNSLVEKLGMAERVRILSYPGPNGDVWAATDIHAHPSLCDSQPISVIEGMSLGMPAVVTATGGIPEIVEHRRTGLVVPPGDSDALAVAILELLRNPTLAMSLGQAARRRYEQCHQPRIMTQALEGMFLHMIR